MRALVYRGLTLASLLAVCGCGLEAGEGVESADSFAVSNTAPPPPTNAPGSGAESCGNLPIWLEPPQISMHIENVNDCAANGTGCFLHFSAAQRGKRTLAPTIISWVTVGTFERVLDAQSRLIQNYSRLYEELRRIYWGQCSALGGIPCYEQIFAGPITESGAGWGDGDHQFTKLGTYSAPEGHPAYGQTSWWGCKPPPPPPPAPPAYPGGACTTTAFQAGRWFRNGTSYTCCAFGTYLGMTEQGVIQCVAPPPDQPVSDQAVVMQAGTYADCVALCDRAPADQRYFCWGMCYGALAVVGDRLATGVAGVLFCDALFSACTRLKQIYPQSGVAENCMTWLWNPLCILNN